MTRWLVPAALLLRVVVCLAQAQTSTPSGIVVFREAGFPSADSTGTEKLALEVSGAVPVTAQQVSEALHLPTTWLLVLPYGSAFPEPAWPAIEQFLRRGGNLLVLGGRPFTRSAFHDNSGWHLRDYSLRFARALMIDQYQETLGSAGMTFATNPDVAVQVPRFSWKRGFSPVIRLSAVDLYRRGGAAGSIDARLDPIVWGTKDRRKLSAPVIEVDHLRNGFDGGRWIFVNA